MYSSFWSSVILLPVMAAMVRRPPQRTALHAAGADRREQELHRARCPERAMGEIAVKS